jgi:N-acetyl-anhydromuramyl-L-alanine amidase AmpD
MVTNEETISTLEADIATAKTNYTNYMEKLNSKIDDGTWDAATAEEQTDALAKKFRKEALVTKAEQALEDYKAKESAFFDVTRKAAFDAFEAEKQAAKDILVSEWQDKEDYAKATSDWELTGYTVDWSA